MRRRADASTRRRWGVDERGRNLHSGAGSNVEKGCVESSPRVSRRGVCVGSPVEASTKEYRPTAVSRRWPESAQWSRFEGRERLQRAQPARQVTRRVRRCVRRDDDEKGKGQQRYAEAGLNRHGVQVRMWGKAATRAARASVDGACASGRRWGRRRKSKGQQRQAAGGLNLHSGAGSKVEKGCVESSPRVRRRGVCVGASGETTTKRGKGQQRYAEAGLNLHSGAGSKVEKGCVESSPRVR